MFNIGFSKAFKEIAEVGSLMLIGMCVVLFGVILSIVLWAMFADSQSPNLATLKKNAWFCSEKHTEIYTTYVKSGNSTVPVTNTRIVCDQYNRK
jgi:hypothetical protein